MKLFKHTALLSTLILLPSFMSTQAAEQPSAESLVGKYYGGLHGTLMSADDDRVDFLNTNIDGSYGIGAEVGYRYSPEVEFRFSYTDYEFDLDDGYSDEDGSAWTVDTLYFLNQKNLYLLGGLSLLDVKSSKFSANLGAGYRYYFKEHFAVYAEGKGYYQFDHDYVDYVAQIGLTYFFGGSNKAPVKQPTAAPAPAPVAAATAAVALDSDKDGVLDTEDSCSNTPMSDKVDEKGCTVFAKKVFTQRLLINFDNNTDVIKPKYHDDIAKVADFLKQYPNVNITIAGHTSKSGSAEYNLKLSQKRANAVVALLESKYGIASNRLTAKGYGESQLINLSDTAQAAEENRRIEAIVEVQNSVPIER